MLLFRFCRDVNIDTPSLTWNSSVSPSFFKHIAFLHVLLLAGEKPRRICFHEMQRAQIKNNLKKSALPSKERPCISCVFSWWTSGLILGSESCNPSLSVTQMVTWLGSLIQPHSGKRVEMESLWQSSVLNCFLRIAEPLFVDLRNMKAHTRIYLWTYITSAYSISQTSCTAGENSKYICIKSKINKHATHFSLWLWFTPLKHRRWSL